MKLYYCPGACSLAGHIALHEAGMPFESESVDLKTKQTATGTDFNSVTVKGYVPALQLDDGQLVTENIAVLDYLASLYPQFAFDGPLARTRLLEQLAYISTEIHKSFKPFWHDSHEDQKATASAYITRRLQYLADTIKGDFLRGDQPGVTDFYLFVTLLWAKRFGVSVPAPLDAVYERLTARPAVQATLKAEGLA
ncbi:glutathione S-transferase N-terminal domain-containing protein [Sphingomonas sp. LaA6.9]|uniref:glutathione S-transferase N-terminal domain-containing protein n=1 Tax=Sphingomonas sp. LaA6.9 TaxID=2919914 RepID=UPI001F4FC64A|nr:glutathione S-transferase N-terminal domain-containing protein [Sphingomonas sp. LaA6.9]MCJ8158222.1 glutathione S-transferase N-terminal domain-containing protein [Sphingomonas sp. LaA6.9]